MAMVMITEACVLGNKDLMTNHFAFVKLANAHLLVGPTLTVGVGCHIGSLHADGVGNCCM